jgi:hypothetical protein
MKNQKGNYMKKVLTAARNSKLRPGTLLHIHVYHEESCPIFQGGRCDCNPAIKTGREHPPWCSSVIGKKCDCDLDNKTKE